MRCESDFDGICWMSYVSIFLLNMFYFNVVCKTFKWFIFKINITIYIKILWIKFLKLWKEIRIIWFGIIFLLFVYFEGFIEKSGILWIDCWSLTPQNFSHLKQAKSKINFWKKENKKRKKKIADWWDEVEFMGKKGFFSP